MKISEDSSWAGECDSWDVVTGVMTIAAAVGASARTENIHCVQCSAGCSVSEKGGSSRRVMPCSTCQLQTSMDGAVSASQLFLKCVSWAEILELEFSKVLGCVFCK